MIDQEAQARDEALDALAVARAGLVARARDIACMLAAIRGQVTPTEVWDSLNAQAAVDHKLRADMDAVDPRWMGVVFRKGWLRIGWTDTGSHKRNVPIWTREG